MIDPEQDGISHINIYSKGKTELGRLLSNFAHTPFDCADGHFESAEGYWYWLSCNHPDKDYLRKLYGYKAKEQGREMFASDWPRGEDFQERFLAGLKCKLEQSPHLVNLLRESELPFLHYYAYGNVGGKYKVYDETAKCQWMIDFWEESRRRLQDGFSRHSRLSV